MFVSGLGSGVIDVCVPRCVVKKIPFLFLKTGVRRFLHAQQTGVEEEEEAEEEQEQEETVTRLASPFAPRHLFRPRGVVCTVVTLRPVV